MNRSREWRWSRSSWPGCTKITCSGTSCLRRNDEVTLKGIQLARAIGVTASIRQDAMHTSRRVAWALLPVNASQPQVSLSRRSKRNVAWLALSISYNLIPLSLKMKHKGKLWGATSGFGHSASSTGQAISDRHKMITNQLTCLLGMWLDQPCASVLDVL